MEGLRCEACPGLASANAEVAIGGGTAQARPQDPHALPTPLSRTAPPPRAAQRVRPRVLAAHAIRNAARARVKPPPPLRPKEGGRLGEAQHRRRSASRMPRRRAAGRSG
eukprot:357485-Chlamydomonas_euryale.AAC.6